ncbi:Manganese transport system membrane protein MntB [Thalassoglobus neptunius]|uniref:Manganese transport system membrane protein MntB n=1 Tax=Thalassoglobus neptunius TaxID=1938619 RepID=A0A5C5WYI9_9PLAN|nr:iron chelate uptake ABC transporter family permease subunit [Thalassoglobus neptunius]TWT55756.1 Manganese transport system membrane protein MntB [Thalassoglobus neptunius]
MIRFRQIALIFMATTWMAGCVSLDASDEVPSTGNSLANQSISWPTWEQVRRVVLLQDYNTRVVVFGTTLLGCAAGIVGSFTLLRRRALMGDALSHATLPGICIAFLLATKMGYDGKSLSVLLLGATVSGILGMLTILWIRKTTQLKDDAALGAVLSVFFGAGVALLGIVQQVSGGHSAGLEAFIYGKTASMNVADAKTITMAAFGSIGLCLVFFKELKLLCFDEKFAGSRGFPVMFLDILLMMTVVVVTIVGLQAVGLVLMIALLVIPAAAARFWSDEMSNMAWISAGLGMVSGMLGAEFSAVFSRLPSGAMIVLICTAFFAISLIFGSKHGLLIRGLRRVRLNRRIDREHLLRAVYEKLESGQGEVGKGVSFNELMKKRSWSERRLRGSIRREQNAGLVSFEDQYVTLKAPGIAEASRLTRQHRLWELYLITHAEIAPSRVDREADMIEHVLDPDMIAELELLLDRAGQDVPASPHELTDSSVKAGVED